MANLLILTTRSQDLQPLSTAGQTAIEAWRALHTMLLRKLSPAHAALLAEPVANQARDEVDWYAEGDGPAVPLQDLPEPARTAAVARQDQLVGEIKTFAAGLADSRDSSDRFLAEMLGLALTMPSPAGVYVRGGQPVLAGWGHVRSGGRGGMVVLTGPALPHAAQQTAILRPPPSPYAAAPAPRTWLWAVLAASLLAPLLALALVWRDPFGWFAIDVPQCRLEPGQLGLAQGLDDDLAREGVLRAELARLTADAGQRRLLCPPVQTAQAAALPSQDAERAQRQGAQGGKLQVILAWDDRNDLDLHVVCPDGVDINFIRRQACGGTLDVDANGDVHHLTPTPVENVFFDQPQPGRYRVVVDPYGMRERAASPFRVTIRRDGQPDAVVTGTAQNGGRNQVASEFAVAAP
jgi:hypothetical protein